MRSIVVVAPISAIRFLSAPSNYLQLSGKLQEYQAALKTASLLRKCSGVYPIMTV